MRQLYRSLTFAVSAIAAVSLHAQQDMSKVEVKATKVAGAVYMLTGAAAT